MTEEEAISKLKDLFLNMLHDSEAAHSRADKILLEVVPPKVKAAYELIRESCSWWATA